MTIPSNLISPDEEKPENIITGEDNFPTEEELSQDDVIPISQETSIVSSNVPPLEDPVGGTAELMTVEESEVIDSTYTDLDESGEMVEESVSVTPPKPAYIAILTIIGLIMLCCVMGGVMLLVLRQEIFAIGL